MKTQLNRQLLNTTTFDSGSLGLMAMVIHQFSEPGHHSVIITKDKRIIAERTFLVDEKSEQMQLNIDLAQPYHKDDCKCKHKDKLDRVSAKGYTLFYASAGKGYSVTVTNNEGKKIFDNAKLTDGDLFAVTLLEPGKYLMENKAGRVKGEIEVKGVEPKMYQKIKSLETIHVEVTPKGFDPRVVHAFSSQGIVFRVHGQARIFIDKEKKDTPQKQKPKVSRIRENLAVGVLPKRR